MAKRTYSGPYRVSAVFPDGWEVEEWEVTKVIAVEGNREVVTSLIPEKRYKHRQAAYRQAANLNKQWLKKHSQSLQAAPQ